MTGSAHSQGRAIGSRLLARVGALAASLAVALPQGLAQESTPPPKASGSPLTRAGIFGQDDRQAVPARHAALAKSIGQMETRVGSAVFQCTVFCLAENVVATAAHCLFEPKLRGHLAKASIAIGQGSERRVTTIHGRSEEAAQWSIIAGTVAVGSERVAGNSARDWAVVRLAEPACKERALALADATDVVPAWRRLLRDGVFILGFHGDKDRRVLRHSGDCLNRAQPLETDITWWIYTVSEQNAGAILPHRCDAYQGSSGAPVLVVTPEGVRVAGINVAVQRPTRTPSAAAFLANQAAANRAVAAWDLAGLVELVGQPPEIVPRESLRAIQTMLAAKGHLGGKPSGVYDHETRQAILSLERAAGMRLTGRPTTELADAARAPERIPFPRQLSERELFGSDEALDRIIRGATRAIELDPANTGAFNDRGLAHRAKGEPERAIADYSRAIEIDRNYVVAYRNRAVALGDKGDFDGAIADTDVLARIEPKSPWTFGYRGHLFRVKGDLRRAVTEYSTAIALDPRFGAAYRNRGIARFELGQLDASVADYTKAIEIDARDAIAYNNRAWTLLKQGKAGQGLPDAERALQIEPAYAPALDTRAHIMEALGRRDEAIADFRRALSLDPGLKESVEGLRRLGVRL
jgi:tetratricopeptide (TPR) repeat protein